MGLFDSFKDFRNSTDKMINKRCHFNYILNSLKRDFPKLKLSDAAILDFIRQRAEREYDQRIKKSNESYNNGNEGWE